MTVDLALDRFDPWWVGRDAPMVAPHRPPRLAAVVRAVLSVAVRRPSPDSRPNGPDGGRRPLTAPVRPALAGSRPVDPDDERALVERARRDRGAFGELYRRHVQAVFGYAFRLTGSRTAAEDITSATFERAMRTIGSYEWQGVGIRPWLLRIARCTAGASARR
jgi:Sigma-70 region 2